MSSFISSRGTFLASSLFLEESLERTSTAQDFRTHTDNEKPQEEEPEIRTRLVDVGALEVPFRVFFQTAP